MMRTLAILALTLTTLAAQAETGPPTAEEVAGAKAECAAEVRQECLFVLALAAALEEARPRQLPRVLNQVAIAQAKAGDVVGADLTLTLTEAHESTLLALGRWDEAYATAERQFPNLAVELGSAEGSFKNNMVWHMLGVNEVDRALATALSIPDGWGERDHALFLIFKHHLDHQDFAAATSAYDLMQDRDYPSRSRAFLALVEAYVKAGLVADAVATLNRTDSPKTEAQARLILAKALMERGSTEAAGTEFELVFASAGREGLPDWGLSILIDAANLALSLGETVIARQHAEAALSITDHDRKQVSFGTSTMPPTRST